MSNDVCIRRLRKISSLFSQLTVMKLLHFHYYFITSTEHKGEKPPYTGTVVLVFKIKDFTKTMFHLQNEGEFIFTWLSYGNLKAQHSKAMVIVMM